MHHTVLSSFLTLKGSQTCDTSWTQQTNHKDSIMCTVLADGILTTKKNLPTSKKYSLMPG